jgi:hypothetical protein
MYRIKYRYVLSSEKCSQCSGENGAYRLTENLELWKNCTSYTGLLDNLYLNPALFHLHVNNIIVFLPLLSVLNF